MAEITGNIQNTIAKAEHDDTGGANTKKVLAYGWDGSNKVRLKVNSSGQLDTTATVQTGDIEIGAVEIKNATDDTRATVSSKGLHVFDNVTNSLVPEVYDYISLSYTGDNLTGVVFKTGGSGGTTVSTLALIYTGSNLTSVTKT